MEPGELVIIFLIVVLVFGGTRLPDLGESLGRLLRGQQRSPPRLLLERRRPWTGWDWTAAIVAALLAVATIVLVLGGR